MMGMETMSPQKDLSVLATKIREVMRQNHISRKKLEGLTGIPDATIGRILKDEVDEVKGTQLKKIGEALGIPFWRLMSWAQIIDDAPPDPSEDAKQIAMLLEDDSELRLTMRKVASFGPMSRKAVMAYIEILRQQSESGLQSPEELR